VSFPVAGDTLTMAVVMRNDEPLTIAVFSLNYDVDGDNELDVVSAFMWQGIPINETATDFFQPLNPLPPGFLVTSSFVGAFQGATSNLAGPRVLPPATSAFAGGYQMGTVVWKINAGANADGADIISGILYLGIDTFHDASSTRSTRAFGSTPRQRVFPNPALPRSSASVCSASCCCAAVDRK
jgi:hypothetical protein